jgi:hypothetical protein
LALATLAMATHAAWAQSSPYYIGVRQAFSHNSNLFKTSDSTKVGDKYSSTSLLGGVDQKLGRQRLFLDASVQTDRYEDVTLLNNVSYNANLGVNWETVGNLSGTVKYTANRGLADYGGPDSPQIQDKNIRDTRQFLADTRLGLTRRVALQAAYEHRSLDYSAAAYLNQQYTQDVGSIGLRYGLPELLVWGIGYRYTKTNTPNFLINPGAQNPEDDAKRDDIDLTVSWIPSSLSTINARISSSRERHSQSTAGDVSGVTGALGWNYRPTGRLQLDASVIRDTGKETTFASLGGTPPAENGTPTTPTPNSPATAVDNDRLTNAVRLGLGYELTGKIRMRAGGGYSKTSSDSTTGTDSANTSYSLGINYDATRAISLACSYTREKQTSTFNGFDTDYKVNLTSCYAQLVLR